MADFFALTQRIFKRFQQDRQRLQRPFCLALAGCMAVGKSMLAKRLAEALIALEPKLKISVVSSDAFVYPNQYLIEKGLFVRKGFPESFDANKMLAFFKAVHAGVEELAVPVYSHQIKDIVTGQEQRINTPDILIVEGINVLQPTYIEEGDWADFFDWRLFLTADMALVEQWYLERACSNQQALAKGKQLWKQVNLPNCQQHVLPSKVRADLFVEKDAEHRLRLMV